MDETPEKAPEDRPQVMDTLFERIPRKYGEALRDLAK